MANLYRLIFAFFSILFVTDVSAIRFRADTRTGSTVEEACESFAAGLYFRQYWRVVGSCSVYQESTNNLWVNACNTSQFYCQGANNAGFTSGVVQSLGFQYLTSGCPSGTIFNPTTGNCIAPPCQAGTPHSGGEGAFDVGNQPTGRAMIFTCSGGCAYDFNGIPHASDRWLVNGTYRYFAFGSYVQNGNECTEGEYPGTPDSVSEIQDTCPPLTHYGLTDFVTGETRCIKISTGEAENPHAPIPPSETTETREIEEHPDGSTTETITRTDPDGTVTVTTRFTDADGNVTQSSVETQPEGKDPKIDLCKQNPELAICREGKIAADKECLGDFKCNGDPVACVTAQYAWLKYCHAVKSDGLGVENDLSNLGQSNVTALEGISQEQADKALNRQGTFDFNIAEAWEDNQQSYVTFTGECVAIPMVQVFGHELDFSVVMAALCSWGLFIKVILHVLAYISVGRMLLSI